MYVLVNTIQNRSSKQRFTQSKQAKIRLNIEADFREISDRHKQDAYSHLFKTVVSLNTNTLCQRKGI